MRSTIFVFLACSLINCHYKKSYTVPREPELAQKIITAKTNEEVAALLAASGGGYKGAVLLNRGNERELLMCWDLIRPHDGKIDYCTDHRVHVQTASGEIVGVVDSYPYLYFVDIDNKALINPVALEQNEFKKMYVFVDSDADGDTSDKEFTLLYDPNDPIKQQ